MKRRGFHPDQALFAPTTKCNLTCGHCGQRRSKDTLSIKDARRFLLECKQIGVKRVAFSGGESFFALDFICSISRTAVREGLLFGRVMTNAVWWRTENDLMAALAKLYDAGYDGEICVSVDDFHEQDMAKVARFIKLAVSTWRRPDVISLAYTHVARDKQTLAKVKAIRFAVERDVEEIFLRTYKIDIAPIGKASRFKRPWDGRWFKEDYCQSPGNVFFVLPDGAVKPCCGYATDRDELTVGNIMEDSAKDILRKVRENRFVRAVFNIGLSGIRRRLERLGVRFPGKTTSHCYFCNYTLTKVPRRLLSKCLGSILLFTSLFITAQAFAQDISVEKECPEIKAAIVKKVKVPKGYHEGLFYDGKSMWLTNGEKIDIWVVDTATGDVTSNIKPVSNFAEAFIRTADGSLFATEWYDMKIYRVTLEDGRLAPEKEALFKPANPAGCISAGDRLFVVLWNRGFGTRFYLVEMDMDLHVTNKMEIKDIREPDQLTWDGANLWISSWHSDNVYRVDINRYIVTGYFKSPASKTTGIAWDGKYMWVTGTHDDLYQMEITEG